MKHNLKIHIQFLFYAYQLAGDPFWIDNTDQYTKTAQNKEGYHTHIMSVYASDTVKYEQFKAKTDLDEFLA